VGKQAQALGHLLLPGLYWNTNTSTASTACQHAEPARRKQEARSKEEAGEGRKATKSYLGPKPARAAEKGKREKERFRGKTASSPGVDGAPPLSEIRGFR
jgi:hypothetical protein